MRPLTLIGIILIVAGGVILTMRGISYTKDRQSVSVGPLSVTTENKGFVPPVVGMIAIVLGGVLVFAGRRRT